MIEKEGCLCSGALSVAGEDFHLEARGDLRFLAFSSRTGFGISVKSDSFASEETSFRESIAHRVCGQLVSDDHDQLFMPQTVGIRGD